MSRRGYVFKDEQNQLILPRLNLNKYNWNVYTQTAYKIQSVFMSNSWSLKQKSEDQIANYVLSCKKKFILEGENNQYLRQKPLQSFHFIFSRIQFTTWPGRRYYIPSVKMSAK